MAFALSQLSEKDSDMSNVITWSRVFVALQMRSTLMQRFVLQAPVNIGSFENREVAEEYINAVKAAVERHNADMPKGPFRARKQEGDPSVAGSVCALPDIALHYELLEHDILDLPRNVTGNDPDFSDPESLTPEVLMEVLPSILFEMLEDLYGSLIER